MRWTRRVCPGSQIVLHHAPAWLILVALDGTTYHMEATACSGSIARAQKRRKWRLFVVGLAVRLLGVLFIWLGDGHHSVSRKALVVVGLILTIGGIGVLRYLLISGFRRKR